MGAKEFLQDSLKISHFYNDKYERMCCLSYDVQLAMQEYAELKCRRLLEILAEKADSSFEDCITSDDILNVLDLNSFCK